MTLSMKLPSVSSELTTSFERAIDIHPASAQTQTIPPACKIFVFEQFSQATAIPANYSDIDDIVDEWEKDAKTGVALQAARRWVAETFMEDEGDTVRSLRLRKGWSQSRLAAEMSTSQPHVARIERGTENLAIETCRRLSTALEIDMNALDKALRRQEASALAKSAT